MLSIHFQLLHFRRSRARWTEEERVRKKVKDLGENHIIVKAKFWTGVLRHINLYITLFLVLKLSNLYLIIIGGFGNWWIR